MPSAHCPDCDGKIVLQATVQVGKKLVCPHCDAELEVIGLDPAELDWAYDESDEDWNKDYED